MSRVVVGNDVVDLTQPRTLGRSSDERFVARVLAPAEQEALRRAEDPDLELWCRWAAKEAGYKVVSKLLGAPPPFVHRSFVPMWTSGPDGGFVRRGVVRYHEHQVPVTVVRAQETVHAVGFAERDMVEPRRPAAGAGIVAAPHVVPRVVSLDERGVAWEGTRGELERRLTPREADAVYSLASAAVRVGARADLASLMRVDEARLQIVCAPGPTSQRPPRVLLDDLDTEADVSLSHDGRWLAWAIWADAPDGADTNNS